MTQRPPLVSIVMCLWNGERFVGPAVESVLAQTFGDFELIVVDDGSVDTSPAVIARFPDPRIRLLRYPHAGTAATLAAGLAQARGAYVAFLDQDDVWSPENLAAHLDVLERRPGVALSFSWFRVIDSAGRDVGLRSVRHHGAATFEQLLEDFVVAGTSNIVARRSALGAAGGVDAAFQRVYDVDLCLRVALLGDGAIVSVPRDLMWYRRHPAQITRDLAGLRREWDQLIDKMRRLAPERVEQVEARARSNICRYCARLAYEGGEYATGVALMGESLHRTPLAFVCDSRNWLTLAACVSGMVFPYALLVRLERMAGLRLPRPGIGARPRDR